MSNPLVHYTKQQYLGKIEMLESYNTRLANHLENLKGYKEQINRFWFDPKAKESYETLSKMIRNVENSRDRVTKALGMYKEIVEQMEGSNLGASDLLKDAASVIGILGE